MDKGTTSRPGLARLPADSRKRDPTAARVLAGLNFPQAPDKQALYSRMSTPTIPTTNLPATHALPHVILYEPKSTMADNNRGGGHRGGGRGGGGGFRGRGGGAGGGHRGGRGGQHGGGTHHHQEGGERSERPKKENILDLSKYQDKEIRVKFAGGREGGLSLPFGSLSPTSSGCASSLHAL